MKKDELKILMLEDDPLDAELNKEHLRLLEEYDCIVTWVIDKSSYLKALESDNIPDIILSDYNIPGYNGIEALRDLKTRNMIIPFIIVTGTIDEETAAGTIKAGAWDYVVKDRLFRLPLAIRGALKLKEERVNTSLIAAKIRQLSLAIEQSPVHIVICNTNHQIDYVNPKFIEVTGYSQDDVIGKDLSMLISEGIRDDFKRSYKFINEIGRNWRDEIQGVKKDGTLFWENMHISPLKNEQGEVTHFIAIMEDITKRKQMELEIIEARDRAERSDKLKDAFLQNLSHEIRTPLNAIVGFSELLGIKELISDEQKEFISIINTSSNQLLSIINDVLTASRIQTGQEVLAVKQVNIHDVINDLIAAYLPIAQSKNLELINTSVKSRFSTLTDEVKVTQILNHFLNNAVKFTYKGKIEIGYCIKDSMIKFYVKDTGIGIPEEYHEVIFERFRKLNLSKNENYGGIGLGLPISKAFAEMLNGSISLESEPGKGSTFFLKIPIQKPVEAKEQSPALTLFISDKPVTILIAEDELNNYLLMEAFLEVLNCKIIHAFNGLEAVDLCRNNPEVNLVLMDIKMPMMDGKSALLEIRKFNADLPVIAQTAYALESDKQELLELGFNEYVSKPIRKQELIDKVVFFLNSSMKK